jgi:hypothetical protein
MVLSMKYRTYAKLVKDSLNDLSSVPGVATVNAPDDSGALFESGGTKYRIALGEVDDRTHAPGEKRISIGWGSRPMTFSFVPDVDHTYFDLRFETHSRILDGFAMKLKVCLLARGFEFLEFGPGGSAPVRKKGWRQFLGA